jgi:hypothetical protein
VLGESPSTAKPWIVVLCDASISKRVKKFFDQSWVKEECRPFDSKEPQFNYIVHKRAPRPISGNKIDIYGSVDEQFYEHLTSCGRLLQVGSGEQTRTIILYKC